MRSRWFFARTSSLLAVALLLALAGCERPRPPRSTRAITIAQFGDFFLYAPLYVAIDSGFFETRGLKVSLISTGGDEKTWAAVLSGEAAFGVADPSFVAIAGERGQPGAVIASIVNGVPFWGITFADIEPFDEPQGLSGHTVATFPAPSTAYALQEKMFRDARLRPSIRQGSFGTLIAMLKANEADIALELEPNVSQAIAHGAHVVYSMKAVYGDFAITGLTATPHRLKEEPQLAEDVVCALQMALDFIRKEPDQALAILGRRFPDVDRSIAQDALRRVAVEGIIPKTAVTSERAWDAAVGLRRQVGDLHSPAPFTTYVVNSFAEKAGKTCRVGG